LSVEEGVTSIETYGCCYVAIDVQLLLSLLDGEGQKTSSDNKLLRIIIMGSLLLPIKALSARGACLQLQSLNNLFED
jgi:hypothetical protein